MSNEIKSFTSIAMQYREANLTAVEELAQQADTAVMPDIGTIAYKPSLWTAENWLWFYNTIL